MNEFIKVFIEWFKNDNHSKIEDYYKDKLTFEKLDQLPKNELIEFFNQFAQEGGKIQSGGYRTAPKLVENINQQFDTFKSKILEPFSPGFDPYSWLLWTENFPYFGKGLATIYLNRIDKYKYVIVNNKSIDGLKKIGFDIPTSNLKKQYDAIINAEKSLLNQFPMLENLFRIDAMMHYLIGTDEGGNKFNELVTKNYFDLKGFKDYSPFFGGAYDKSSPAVQWFYDTRKKLEYLVALLSQKLNRNYVINYKERPNNQARKLKNYVLTGFSPDNINPQGELFIKLAFHDLNNSPIFDIEIDVDEKIKDNPFKKDRDERRDGSRKRIPVDQSFPNHWASLVENISGQVEKLTKEYEKIMQIEKPIELASEKNKSLNKILYGPPGTGKTFHSISHAISIIDNENIDEVLERCETDRESVKKRFDELVEIGQIVFCTFHQSMGYEDFIEGIKPTVSSLDEEQPDEEQLRYIIEDGIFKKLCTDAAFSFIQQNLTPITEKVLDFSIEYDRFLDSVNDLFAEDKKSKILTISGQTLYIESISQKNNIVIRHINGTRSYIVSKQRLSKISQAFPDLRDVTNINEQFRAVIGGSNASAYWSVLNAIRNQPTAPSTNTIKSLSERVYTYKEKKDLVESLSNNDYKILNPKRYVLVIDEINRGNVSQIFGELITLIENDKRLGNNEALKAILPYSKDNFGVPCNLHIIGTMNTADRSVEALDTALRRRFAFVLMSPKPELLKVTDDGIRLPEMLHVLNNRLAVLKDNDHTIGHAWLWEVTNIEQLKNVFKNRILPLLQEYFYNDSEKLGLVLGDAFFEPHVQVNSKIFAPFSGGNGLAGQYDQSWQYQLKAVEKLTISDFQSLENSKDKPSVDEEY